MTVLSLQQRLVEGNAESPVRVVVYEDLQCGDCRALRELLDQVVLPRYGAQVAVEHRDFPLPKHPWAWAGAVAARHFERQSVEIGLAFRRYAMENLRVITLESLNEHLAKFGGAPLGDAGLHQLVDADYQEGVARGVVKTPTVFVKGARFVERFPIEALTQAIENAIAEQDQ